MKQNSVKTCIALGFFLTTTGCVSVPGGDSRVGIFGKIVGANSGTCVLALLETNGDNEIASIDITVGEFHRSMLFHSRQRIDKPVALYLTCPDHDRLRVTDFQAIGRLTHWRNPVDLGTIDLACWPNCMH